MMTADERTDGRTADKTEKQGLIRFGDFYAGMISGTCHIDDLKAFLKKTGEIASETGVSVQGLNADMIAGRRHILFAVKRAAEAFETGRNGAKDRGLEIMRFASGQRQIEKAFQIGLFEGDVNCLFVLSGNSPDQIGAAEGLLSGLICVKGFDETVRPCENREKQASFFSIGEDEIRAVSFEAETGKTGSGRSCPDIPAELFEDLVIERVALVDHTK